MAKIDKIYIPQISQQQIPLFDARISAGFPSPATDYQQSSLDLNRYLIKNPAATFFVKVSGDSMIGAGIHDGDLLIVDRSLTAKNGNVIIALVDGELNVKRLRIRRGKVSLEPENDQFPTKNITDDTDFQVWGVVTNVIHSL